MAKPLNSLSLIKKVTIISRIKEGYLIWIKIAPHIPRCSRYTIGQRIENNFLDLLELSYQTYFTNKDQKSKKISECILILDTLKFLISVSWEAKLISHKQYEEISLKLDEVGKMFSGWKNSFKNPDKKNRTDFIEVRER